MKRSKYFARIFEDMFCTAAWKDLNGTEAKLYLEMVRKYRGNNNGAIVFGRREAEEVLKIGPNTVLRAFTGLQRRGFIVPVVKGSFSRKLIATEWRLTEYKCDVTGEVATEEFRRWIPEVAEKPPENLERRRQNGTRIGAKTAPAQAPKRHHPSKIRSNCNKDLAPPTGAKTAPLSISAIHLPTHNQNQPSQGLTEWERDGWTMAVDTNNPETDEAA
jgi:hypothetical protein